MGIQQCPQGVRVTGHDRAGRGLEAGVHRLVTVGGDGGPVSEPVLPGDRAAHVIDRQVTLVRLGRSSPGTGGPQQFRGRRAAIEVCLPDHVDAPVQHLSDGARLPGRVEGGLEEPVHGVQRLRAGRQPQVLHQARPRGEPVSAGHCQLGVCQGMPSLRGEAHPAGMKVSHPGQCPLIPGPPRC